ncbi:MAG: DUF4238 domain-containing protein, partial [Bacilli bacterium]|nr:DUF4238 domain-containing protein [Bacilli bacterium]
QETYMYGSNLVWEKKLQQLEGKWNTAVDKMIAGIENDECLDTVRKFILFQKVRTNQDIDIVDGNLRSMISTLLPIISANNGIKAETHHIKYLTERIMQEKYSRDKISNINLEIAEENQEVFANLKLIRVINMTGMPFVTSNNPVIYMNPFQKEGLGLKVGGIVLVVPSNPNNLFILADSSLYPALRTSEKIELYDESIVLKINFLQYTHSDGLTYSSNENALRAIIDYRQIIEMKKFKQIIFEIVKIKFHVFDPVIFNDLYYPRFNNEEIIKASRYETLKFALSYKPQIDLFKLDERLEEYQNNSLFTYERMDSKNETLDKIRLHINYRSLKEQYDTFINILDRVLA